MAPYQSISALRLFAYVTAGVILVTTIANLVTYLYAEPLAGVGLTILICAPFVLRGNMWVVMGGVVAALLAALGGPAIAEYGRVARGQHILALDEAAPRPGVSQLGLAGAGIDLAATRKNRHSHTAGRGRVFEHAIAPIVPPTWQPGQPVLLYAACHDITDDPRRCMDAWNVPTESFVRVLPSEEACYQQMVPGSTPAIFVYHTDPNTYLHLLWREWLGMTYIPALAWLLIGGLVATRNTRTMRRLAAVE